MNVIRRHQDLVLGISAALLVLLLALYFGWGVRFLARALGDASAIGAGSGAGAEFRLERARSLLRARGLIE